MSIFKNFFKSKNKTITDFSDIGFPVDSVDDFMIFGGMTCQNGQKIEIHGKGSYYYWTLDSGAQLWAQVKQNEELMGMHPSFVGKSKVHLKMIPYFTERMTPLDGLYSCWLITDDQEYPLVFEAPNFYQQAKGGEEINGHVQITAFASKEFEYFDDVSERDKHVVWSQWAVQSFAPTGLHQPNLDEREEKSPHALFSGYIKELELRINEITGSKFWWAYVETLSQSYDVVIDPQLFKSTPTVGGIIAGSFYLSGKIIE